MTKEKILEYFADINTAYNDCTRYETLSNMLDEFAIEALRTQADGDLISRSRMLADLKENYEFMTVDGYADLFNDFIEFIKRQPRVAIPSAEPCEDAISRQVVNNLQKYRYNCGDTSITCISLKSVNDLPPVKPQEPTGYWILKRTFPTKIYDEYLNEYKCSECYREIRCTESQLVNYPYCHCGAKMIEQQESEVNNG